MSIHEPPSALNDQLLQAMADRGGVKTFPANAVLVNEEDESDSIFILLKGKVKVYGAGANGREVVYTTLGPGEYFGEMTLDGGPRSASVMTLEPTTCVVVTGANVRDFLAHHPDFALHLIRKLIALVRRSTDTVKRLALDDVYTRIYKLLYELAVDDDGRLVVREADAAGHRRPRGLVARDGQPHLQAAEHRRLRGQRRQAHRAAEEAAGTLVNPGPWADARRRYTARPCRWPTGPAATHHGQHPCT
jgi:CRP/FNR family cyclic AMP-dependent transcriptional regulator